MSGYIFTIERREPVNKGGGSAGISRHETSAGAIAALARCARRLQKGELGSVKLTGHQHPIFSHTAYFADDIAAMIEAIKESGR